MMKQYFTLNEAQDLVPWLTKIFESITPIRERVRHLYSEIAHLEESMRSNGGNSHGNNLYELRRDLNKKSADIQQHLQDIINRGMEVKGLEEGLVDFPHMRNENEVYLCWKEGESEIQFWHETDTGFTGRQLL